MIRLFNTTNTTTTTLPRTTASGLPVRRCLFAATPNETAAANQQLQQIRAKIEAQERAKAERYGIDLDTGKVEGEIIYPVNTPTPN